MYRLLTLIVLFLPAFSANEMADQESASGLPNRQQELFVLVMTSSSGRFNSSGAELAVRLALDRINTDNSLLKRYSLEVAEVQDTKCEQTTSIHEFLSKVLVPFPTIIGVIGCGCSVATKPIADVSSLYGLPLISYTPSGVSAEANVKFSLSGHLQLFPSELNIAVALLAVIKEFGWRQLSILTQNDQPFIQMEQTLVEDLTDNDITVLSSDRFGSDQDLALFNNTLFVRDARVFIVNSYEDKARQLLCVFKSTRLKDTQYAWILLYGWYSAEWWRSTNDINCNENELSSMLERALVIEQYPKTDNMSTDAVGGLTQQEFEKLKAASSSPYVETLAYDSAWSLALALNRTMNMIESNDTQTCGQPLVPLEEFTYGESSTACLIRHSLSRTNFTGVSGPVMFNMDGSRQQRAVRLLQYRNVMSQLTLKLFATVTVDVPDSRLGSIEYVNGESNCTLWPEVKSGDCPPPHDGTPKIVISNFRLESVLILYIMGGLGFIITTICLLFNFIFRNRKVVRLTSPNLNYFILLGAYLLFSSPFTGMPYYTQDIKNWTSTCLIRMYTDGIGYAFVFGTILAKLWRIYFIFHDPFRKTKRKVSDWRMALIIFAIVSVVIVILVIGTAIPYVRPNAYTSDDLENQPKQANGTLQKYVVIDCLSSEASYWVLVLFGYLGLLQVASFILALLNRKVTIKVLNDSKEITLIVYITSFAALEMVVLYFVVGNFSNANASLYTGHLLAATVVAVLIVYIPKMISLYKDPKGENIFDKSVTTTLQNGKNDSSVYNSMERKLSIGQTRPLVYAGSTFSSESTSCANPGSPVGNYMDSSMGIGSPKGCTFAAITEEDKQEITLSNPTAATTSMNGDRHSNTNGNSY